MPTRFLKSWIESHYIDRVLATFRAEAPDVDRVEIGVRGTAAPVRPVAAAMSTAKPAPTSGPLARLHATPAATAPVAPSPEPRTATAGADANTDFAGTPLDARLTFTSFVVGRSNALAHAAAERIARHQGRAPSTIRSTSMPASASARRTCCTASAMPPARVGAG